MELTKEQTIKALGCCISDNCKCCSISNDENCCNVVRENALRYLKENEPAPAATETSSTKENILHFDDNTSERICQALKNILSRLYEAFGNDLESNTGIRLYGEAMGLLEALIDQLKAGTHDAKD